MVEGNIYGYVRGPAGSQEIDRQVMAMWDFGISQEHVFIEREAAGNPDMQVFWKMTNGLLEEDTLVIQSLDVLGRDSNELVDRWRYITMIKKAGILVLDLPLMNTGIEEDALGKVVARITLGIMQYFDQSRQYKKRRQAEGIAEARSRGIKLGRRPKEIPEDFESVRRQWEKGEISVTAAARMLHVDIRTFRKWAEDGIKVGTAENGSCGM